MQTVVLREGTSLYGISEMVQDASNTGALNRATVRHIRYTIIEPCQTAICEEHTIDFYFSRDVRGYSDELMPWEISGPTREEVLAENAEFDRECARAI